MVSGKGIIRHLPDTGNFTASVALFTGLGNG